ncbi:MAG: prolyl oligopeptidase family serine peptidase [Rhizobiales bacterium]|nr:prolyl oligopeptidase family serine peptidase [Hyphomicrobiales bacterium]
MAVTRKEFTLGLAATLGAAGGAATSAIAADATGGGDDGNDPTSPRGAGQSNYFFKNSTMEFTFLGALGKAYSQAADVGKLLYLSRQIKDGDFESAFTAFKAAGDEAASIAEASSARGHRESARQAWLWAQAYYDAALYFADGSSDPSRMLPTWELLYGAWLKAIACFDPPGEPVDIPYEGTALKGFYFRGPGATGRRPLLIMNNGSDGSLLDMWHYGGTGALARGYDMLTFDGPGQGQALWKQKLHFRPDWEKVITPVVDFALSRDTVDPKRIALLGISQGGYWVPRAVAFEHRVAAAVADPGVVDVSASWTASLPKELIALLDAGKKDVFDGAMSQGMPTSLKAGLAFRMRPFGTTSYYDAFKATMDYRLTDAIVGQIACPMLITLPEGEAFWPGQSQKLHDMLKSPKVLQPFTVEEGADLHCEPKAAGLRGLRIFDWLDETLA